MWLPNQAVASAWSQYCKDTALTDETRPPAPWDLRVHGAELTWKAEADVESGLAHFIIERDGRFLATVPEKGRNPFGRPVFQNLQYSDTPSQPLMAMRFTDKTVQAGQVHRYTIRSVNTVGLSSTAIGPARPRSREVRETF